MHALKLFFKVSIVAVVMISTLMAVSLVVPFNNRITLKVYAASPASRDHPANSQQAAHCNADQEATKIENGSDRGKWYCKDKPQRGVGGGAVADDSGAYVQGKTCGGRDYNYYTPSIDIGCLGRGNPIADAIFGFIRFLSAGVGLVIVGSIIVGGIQYSGSRGDPQSTAMAINRIRSSLYALLIFIFAYAILNYIIPAGFLNQ